MGDSSAVFNFQILDAHRLRNGISTDIEGIHCKKIHVANLIRASGGKNMV